MRAIDVLELIIVIEDPPLTRSI